MTNLDNLRRQIDMIWSNRYLEGPSLSTNQTPLKSMYKRNSGPCDHRDGEERDTSEWAT